MEKIAFIDLDGVVADSQKRFAKATRDGKINWGLAFHPPLLGLDELVAEADNTILALENGGWKINYLSSRPERLREATEKWLEKHNLAGRNLILRPDKTGGLKTPAWKASVVCQLGEKAERVLFVDDEPENASAVKSFWAEKVAKDNLHIIDSLALAHGLI